MHKDTPIDPQKLLGQLVTVHIDRPLGSRHPDWHFIYPVNYGFVPGVLSPDGDELDAYVLGIHQPLSTFTGKCIAVLQRKNDPGDPKLILTTPGTDLSDEDILGQIAFQEQFFDSEIRRKEK